MMKWPLLILMSITILTMLGFPGCYDSRRRAVARRHFYDSPNDVTRRELRQAKVADWKDIGVYEAVLGGLLGATLFAYFRVQKAADKNEN